MKGIRQRSIWSKEEYSGWNVSETIAWLEQGRHCILFFVVFDFVGRITAKLAQNLFDFLGEDVIDIETALFSFDECVFISVEGFRIILHFPLSILPCTGGDCGAKKRRPLASCNLDRDHVLVFQCAGYQNQAVFRCGHFFDGNPRS